MNILRLSLKDNEDLAALFAGMKPGEKVSLTIEGVINRNDPEEVTTAVRKVESKDIFPDDEDDDDDDDDVIEDMREEDESIKSVLSKKNQDKAPKFTGGY